MRINYPDTFPETGGHDAANEFASRFKATKDGVNLSAQFRGTYSSATAYDVNDIVTYSGVRYLCILAGTNQQPDTATTYWELLDPTATIEPARRITTSQTVKASDRALFVDATAGNITITLLAATTKSAVAIKKVDASANTVTVTRAGSDTIDGATTKVLSTQYASFIFQPDGSAMWGLF